MVLLGQKLGRSLKFSSKTGHQGTDSEVVSASLRDFQSKVAYFLNQILLKTEPGSTFVSLEWFEKCFELIHVGNLAFAKMVVEIDYPTSKWGRKLREEYLNYTINLLDLLNSINSSISHLIQTKLSILHALSLIEHSPSSASNYLKKTLIEAPRKVFKAADSSGVEESTYDSKKEPTVLEALKVLKEAGFLALGFVSSGMCGDSETYMEVRKFVEKFDDLMMVKGLDSRFCKEIELMRGNVVEVKEVNTAAARLSEAISTGRYQGALKELKRKLEVMENSIEGIEKKANTLFSEVLSTRNKVLDNIRLTGKNP